MNRYLYKCDFVPYVTKQQLENTIIAINILPNFRLVDFFLNLLALRGNLAAGN